MNTKVIRKHFDEEAFIEACKKVLRDEYGMHQDGYIPGTYIGAGGPISQQQLVDRVKEKVGKENFTKTEEYLLHHIQVNWTEDYRVYLVVTDMDGKNIQLISAEGCELQPIYDKPITMIPSTSNGQTNYFFNEFKKFEAENNKKDE